MSIQADGRHSRNNNWETPAWLVEIIAYKLSRGKYRYFDLDPAAAFNNSKALLYYDEKADGLRLPWKGRVFLNPPWGRAEKACKPNCLKKTCAARGFHLEKDMPGIGAWVKKAQDEAWTNPEVESVVALVPTNNTDASWFHDHGLYATTLIFLRGRVAFEFNREPHKNNAVASSIFVFDRYWDNCYSPAVFGWDLKQLRKQWDNIQRLKQDNSGLFQNESVLSA